MAHSTATALQAAQRPRRTQVGGPEVIGNHAGRQEERGDGQWAEGRGLLLCFGPLLPLCPSSRALQYNAVALLSQELQRRRHLRLSPVLSPSSPFFFIRQPACLSLSQPIPSPLSPLPLAHWMMFGCLAADETAAAAHSSTAPTHGRIVIGELRRGGAKGEDERQLPLLKRSLSRCLRSQQGTAVTAAGSRARAASRLCLWPPLLRLGTNAEDEEEAQGVYFPVDNLLRFFSFSFSLVA